ncbi:hypothetical protein P7K49_003827 [Saguinus oedipus]|uniref:Uncharacterized protein n=1 Tax=Saguinus oedipus TaxID=9490 RepID=A0ABQ9W5N0_SAGOE|nr:hypothetical protein P7K49_003827 [Saguinus oedipus]
MQSPLLCTKNCRAKAGRDQGMAAIASGSLAGSGTALGGGSILGEDSSHRPRSCCRHHHHCHPSQTGPEDGVDSRRGSQRAQACRLPSLLMNSEQRINRIMGFHRPGSGAVSRPSP